MGTEVTGRNNFTINPILRYSVQTLPDISRENHLTCGMNDKGLGRVDILLHLGAHRCASTTFQSYLWANRLTLSKRGLTCWTPRRTRDGLLVGMLRHPAMITVEDERKAIRSTGRLRIEMERLRRADQQALLISEENIIGSMRNNIADTRLYPLLRERLMRFLPAFEGRKMRIGLSIRSYEDFWTSSLANLLSRGGGFPSVDLLDFLTTQPRRWRHVVRDVAAVFPEAEIVVWPFERLAGQPHRQLTALWDGDTRGLADDGHWRNRSADIAELNKLMALRGEHLVLAGLVEAGARWMPFDDDQRRVLRAEYRRDLAWLMQGADGLATFEDGRTARTEHTGDMRPTHAADHNSGANAPALVPDRAQETRGASDDALLFGGQHDGIKKGLGRTGAS